MKLEKTDSKFSEIASFLSIDGSQIYCIRHLCFEEKGVVLLAGPIVSERPFSYAPWVRWARYLAASGFVVVRFDYRGVGESTGSFAEMNLRTWAKDIELVAGWIRADFTAGPLILHGLGLGALLAADCFERGLGDALLLWSAPSSGEDVLRESLLRRISIDYLLHPKGPRKTYEDYVADIKSGSVLQVVGYPWSRRLWDGISEFRLPITYLAETECLAKDGRPWKTLKLNRNHVPLVSGLGQWQAVNPRAQVKMFPLNPDLNSLFAANRDWICKSSAIVSSKST